MINNMGLVIMKKQNTCLRISLKNETLDTLFAYY